MLRYQLFLWSQCTVKEKWCTVLWKTFGHKHFKVQLKDFVTSPIKSRNLVGS